MGGITFGAKLHERGMHVLIDRATHVGCIDDLLGVKLGSQLLLRDAVRR